MYNARAKHFVIELRYTDSCTFNKTKMCEMELYKALYFALDLLKANEKLRLK